MKLTIIGSGIKEKQPGSMETVTEHNSTLTCQFKNLNAHITYNCDTGKPTDHKVCMHINVVNQTLLLNIKCIS